MTTGDGCGSSEANARRGTCAASPGRYARRSNSSSILIRELHAHALMTMSYKNGSTHDYELVQTSQPRLILMNRGLIMPTIGWRMLARSWGRY